MKIETVRLGLYAERLLVAFASGIFLTLPLYFKLQGQNEVFFGQIYAAGAIGALLFVSIGARLVRKFGLRKIAPLGSGLFALGSACYFFAATSGASTWAYAAASLIQGAGWGLLFTLGPICMSSTVKGNDHAHFFTMYAAYSTLGMGAAPIFAKFVMLRHAMSFATLFATAAAISLLACCLAAYVAWNNTFYERIKLAPSLSGLKEFKKIMKLPSGYFFAMVLCGACVYSVLINLQTTLAAAQHLDYTVFYACYSLAVVASRFVLSKPLGKLKPAVSIKWLMVLTIAALGLMLEAGQSAICYGVAASLLGLGYGLLYPIVQAQAAVHAPDHLRPQTLVYFSLIYFAAMYLCPCLGAAVAVAYGYGALLAVLIAVALLELLLVLYFYRVPARQLNRLRFPDAAGSASDVY